ncbi:hypothetical protein FRC16_009533, partial [Serendipita sp. 398]
IIPGMNYDDLNLYLNQLKPNHRLVALVPIFGPYPYFRYSSPSEPISPSVRKVFVIDENEFNSVIVVRTIDGDVVIAITLSQKENHLPTMDVIRAHISAHGHSPIIIKDYSGQSDIGSQSLGATMITSQQAHPTIAFVETHSVGYDFRTQFMKRIPVTEPLEFLLARGGVLIQKASQVDIRLFHLTRAMIHLIVSAQKTVSSDRTLGVDLRKALHRLEDRLNSGIYSQSALQQNFLELCGDYPGAVAVRHSYGAFSRLNAVDSSPNNGVFPGTDSPAEVMNTSQEQEQSQLSAHAKQDNDGECQSSIARETFGRAESSPIDNNTEKCDHHHHPKARDYATEHPLAEAQESHNLREHISSKPIQKAHGFIELSPGQDPIVDIVAIHGPEGHREQSWTAEDGTMRSKDLLPVDIPNLRILSYDYDADTRSFSRKPTQSISRHAEALVEDLSWSRRAADPKVSGFVGQMSDPRQLIKQIKDRLQSEGRREQITFAYKQVGTPPFTQWTCTYSMDGQEVATGESKPNKDDAMLSAARYSLPIIRVWLDY